MKLTDTVIKQSKPKDKPYKLTDGLGLYLHIQTNGAKYWRMDYRFFGKRKTLAIGVYPDIPLKQAREAREEARKLIADGTDPSDHKRNQKEVGHLLQLNTFEAIAREWFSFKEKTWVETTAQNTLSRLKRFVFPYIGKKPITDIVPADLISLLRRVEQGSSENAHKTNNHCSQIFKYAIAKGLPVRNLCVDMQGHILQPIRSKHFPTILDPKEIAHFLQACYEYKHSAIVKNALLLAPLLFVRPGELRLMKWADISFEDANWEYFVSKTKIEHHVPLAKQAIAILEEMRYLTGECVYVFSAVGYAKRKTHPMSEGSVNKAIRNLGYDTKNEITGHGFRAMARTLLAEKLRFPEQVIEHQLAHKVPDSLGTAYNRTKFLEDRIKMMQAWADYLDSIRLGAQVIPLSTRYQA